MRQQLGRSSSIIAMVLFISLSSSAQADFVTWGGTGTTGTGSAQHSVDITAKFTADGSNLKVQVFNNSKTIDPVQILSGIVWNVNGTAPTGTSFGSAATGDDSALFTSASSSSSSSDLRNSTLGGGKGWQYATTANSGLLNVGGQQYQFGLGASGLGGTFGGLGNADYGLAGPRSSIGTNPLKNQLPLVMSKDDDPSEIDFVITNYSGSASDIKDVLFMFGSAGSDNVGGVPVVPEPSSIILFGLGVGAVFMAVRRKAKVQPAA